MDRRPIRQILAQIVTEFFLCAAADGDDHMRGAILFQQQKEISVFDFQAVPGRDITVLVGNGKTFPILDEPYVCLSCCLWQHFFAADFSRKFLCE